MPPEKTPTRIRTTLAQKMRFLHFTCGWSRRYVASALGVRSWLAEQG